MNFNSQCGIFVGRSITLYLATYLTAAVSIIFTNHLFTSTLDEKLVGSFYRFTNGEYKEKGLGDVKILKHKTTGNVRVILRREKVLKLACNHMIKPDMNLTTMDSSAGKAWIWYALDFAEGGEGTEEMFAIR